MKEDMDRLLYQRLQEASLEDLIEFQKQYVKGRHYSFMVLGDEKQIDIDYLSSFGALRKLSMEEVFGY